MMLPAVCTECKTKYKSRTFYIDIGIDEKGDIVEIRLICDKCGARWIIKVEQKATMFFAVSPSINKRKVIRC